MPVSTMQLRVEIGIFNTECKVRFPKMLTSQKATYTLSFCSLSILFVFILLMLLVCGNIELNPVSRKRNTCYNLSIGHWNLNSIAAHNFEKAILLEAYNTVNKFDIICLLEAYLDFSILSANDNLVIKGYKLVKDDYPDDIKGGGVCAYIRESLPARCLFNTYLKICLILEVSMNKKKSM